MKIENQTAIIGGIFGFALGIGSMMMVSAEKQGVISEQQQKIVELQNDTSYMVNTVIYEKPEEIKRLINGNIEMCHYFIQYLNEDKFNNPHLTEQINIYIKELKIMIEVNQAVKIKYYGMD